jgi:dihydrofolate reductase
VVGIDLAPRISLVYAQSRNGIIGTDGALPWNIPSDLKRFKETTLGKPVIMGRKTWESLPRRPLSGRQNIVITRNADYAAEGADIATSAKQARDLAGDVPELCVIGGGEIYNMFLPSADRIYLTEVDIAVQGDTLAPALSPGDWREVSREGPFRGEKDSASYVVRVLERIR